MDFVFSPSTTTLYGGPDARNAALAALDEKESAARRQTAKWAASDEDGLSLHWLAGRIGETEAHVLRSMYSELRVCLNVHFYVCPCGNKLAPIMGKYGEFVSCFLCGFKSGCYTKAGQALEKIHCGHELVKTVSKSNYATIAACPVCNRLGSETLAGLGIK